MSAQIIGFFVNQDFPVCEDCINFSEEEISCPIDNVLDDVNEDIICTECGDAIVQAKKES